MKAIRVLAWGQPVQFEEVPQPKPASDEVLVRVQAASVNPFDTFVHAGYMQELMATPLTLGTDFAGEVVETGAGVQHVAQGDAVYGLVPMHAGSFAEYLVAKSNEVAHKPKTLSFIEAAGVPLAGMAAYQSVFTLGKPQPGERVLIIGAVGSVGRYVIQFVHEIGAEIYAVSRSDKSAFVEGLGVDRFINSEVERYEDVVGKVDLVFDFAGGEHVQRSYNVLKDGGRYVTGLMLPPPPEEVERRGIRSFGLATEPNVAHLDEIAQRIDSGKLKVFVNRVYPLSEAQAAMDFRLNTIEPGKIILSVQ